MKHKETLLSKALGADRGRWHTIDFDEDKFEAAMAYVNGDITANQLAVAIKAGRSNVRAWIGGVLVAAIRNGRLVGGERNE